MDLHQLIKISLTLNNELQSLDIDLLQLTPAGKSYYLYNQKKLEYTALNNAYMLYHITYNHNLPFEKITILDHGGGIGFFSFLCKKTGVKNVIYHDISESYKNDAIKIGAAIGCPIDHLIVGHSRVLVYYCRNQRIKIDGLWSRNVIEHIPVLEVFFNDIKKIISTTFIGYISTSANYHNPLVNLYHRYVHYKYDHIGFVADMHSNKVNRSTTGYNVRLKILMELQVSDLALVKMARLTREMSLDEIKLAVANFKLKGEYPKISIWSSNIREPISGTWVERLLPYRTYQMTLIKQGFISETLPGFYNKDYKNSVMRYVAVLLNKIIDIWPFNKIYLSPFLAFKFYPKFSTDHTP